jgi:hypothetical protein
VSRILRTFLSLATLAWLMRPASLGACAACYGQSDSPMARGMNWGIFSLLVVVVGVLGSIASFFVFLAKKSASVSGGKTEAPSHEPTQKL